MDNYEIADQFSLLSKLMDIHGDDSFKSKSYSSAAFNLEKLPQSVAAMEEKAIFQIKGIGSSVGKKIIEIIQTVPENMYPRMRTRERRDAAGTGGGTST